MSTPTQTSNPEPIQPTPFTTATSSPEYLTRELYGSSLSTSLPASLFDTSLLRQVPDNQEVFLSHSTLTSIVFELNEYQQLPDVDAVKLHFTDAIDESDLEDVRVWKVLRETMSSASLAKFPAYVLTGEVGKEKVVIHQLLVRMEEYGTDLCVRVNVPLKEFTGKEEEGKKEVEIARRCLQEIVRSLEVKDFSIFNG